MNDTSLAQILSDKQAELGMDQKQFAFYLNIPTNILQTLLKEDWNNLPAEVYLRVYLSTLAQKLNLDKEFVISLCPIFNKTTEENPTTTQYSFNTQGDGLKGPKKIPLNRIFFFIALMGVIFAGIKFYLHQQILNQAASQNSDSMNLTEAQTDSVAIEAQHQIILEDTLSQDSLHETHLNLNSKSQDSSSFEIQDHKGKVQVKQINPKQPNFDTNFRDTLRIKLPHTPKIEMSLNDSLVDSVPKNKFIKIYNGEAYQ